MAQLDKLLNFLTLLTGPLNTGLRDIFCNGRIWPHHSLTEKDVGTWYKSALYKKWWLPVVVYWSCLKRTCGSCCSSFPTMRSCMMCQSTTRLPLSTSADKTFPTNLSIRGPSSQSVLQVIRWWALGDDVVSWFKTPWSSDLVELSRWSYGGTSRWQFRPQRDSGPGSCLFVRLSKQRAL